MRKNAANCILLNWEEKDGLDFKNRLAIIAVLAAGSLWGMMGIFVRRYNSLGLQTMDIVTIRAVGTALFLLLFSLAKNHTVPRIKLI